MFVPVATPAFNSCILLSTKYVDPPVRFARTMEAVNPVTVAPTGIAKPKPEALMNPLVLNPPLAFCPAIVLVALLPSCTSMYVGFVQAPPEAAVHPLGPWTPLVDEEDAALTAKESPCTIASAGNTKGSPVAKSTALVCPAERATVA
jgi:hypothetical protein